MQGDNIRTLQRPQVISEEVLVAIEEQIAKARRGEVVDIVCACHDASGATHFRSSDFEDTWRMLGALEYAKDAVLRGVGCKT